MPSETFIHNGISFRVSSKIPDPQEIMSGQWIRLCYDPYSSKNDTVAEVLACDLFWPREQPRVDFRLTLARNGDGYDTFQTLFSDQYIELVEPVEPTVVKSSGAAEHRPTPRLRRASMNIVVCFDGTWNENETQNTNVHRIFARLDKSSCISAYFSGVGVGGRLASNLLDAMGGRGLFRIVRAAYTFVRGNFISGDRIFIFGFSRGAYAARHLAGMIARIGIHEHTEIGYNNYRKSLLDETATWQAKAHNHNVQFLGLFDCVPGNQIYTWRRSQQHLNNPFLEPNIRNFAHAVAREERRWSFRPLVFEKRGQIRFNQAWFPGFHFDIGGDRNRPFNDFALAWMLAEARDSGLSLGIPSLTFDPEGPGCSSDWLLTKIGLMCRRERLAEARLIAEQPGVSELRDRIAN